MSLQWFIGHVAVSPLDTLDIHHLWVLADTSIFETYSGRIGAPSQAGAAMDFPQAMPEQFSQAF